MAAGDIKHGPYGSCGEVVGTGALLNVSLGYAPLTVKIVNRTQLANADWHQGMPQDSMSLVDDSGAGTTDITFVTSNAITTGSSGFALGTNATLNTAADVIYWEATRSFR